MFELPKLLQGLQPKKNSMQQGCIYIYIYIYIYIWCATVGMAQWELSCMHIML